MSNTFGSFIENLRKTKKMSLRDVAEKSGLSFTYIRDLEIGHGRRTKTPIKPTVDTVIRLADAYDFPKDDLVKLAAGILGDSGFEQESDDKTPPELEEMERFVQKAEAGLLTIDGVPLPDTKVKALRAIFESYKEEMKAQK